MRVDKLPDNTDTLKQFADDVYSFVGRLNRAIISDTFFAQFEKLANLSPSDSARPAFSTNIDEIMGNRTATAASPYGSIGEPGLLTPLALQKKTIAFYDNQRESNSSLIMLLESVNGKLDMINGTISAGDKDVASAVKGVFKLF